MSSERTRLEEIRKRDAVLHPSWFTVDDTDDCVLRVDQTLAARAIKDRRWLLELVDDLRAQLDAVEQVISAYEAHGPRARQPQEHGSCGGAERCPLTSPIRVAD